MMPKKITFLVLLCSANLNYASSLQEITFRDQEIYNMTLSGDATFINVTGEEISIPKTVINIQKYQENAQLSAGTKAFLCRMNGGKKPDETTINNGWVTETFYANPPVITLKGTTHIKKIVFEAQNGTVFAHPPAVCDEVIGGEIKQLP
jgi:hypothetical protein